MSHADLRRRLLGDLQRLRAPEGYLRAGSPRYHTLFGRDALISAWQTLDIDPAIARATLRVLAKYQGKRVHAPAEEDPGKILHEHRFDPATWAELPGWEFPYYGSVDSTPLFLIVAEATVRQSEDRRFLEELWGPVEAAYGWMREYGDLDGDGYLEYDRRNPHALLHQGWKDGVEDHLRIRPPVAVVEAQGYAFAAHRAFASLAEDLGRRELAREARGMGEALRGAFNRDFWMSGEGTFALALDGEKRPRTAVTSNPGHLLFTGVIDADKVRPVVERLFRDDLWTPYGIRTHATSEPDFDPFGYHTGTVWPHDNWIVYKGLQVAGFDREADRIREALVRAHEELGRIPELYAVVDGDLIDLSDAPRGGTRANPLQAWSSAALLEMIGDDRGSASP